MKEKTILLGAHTSISGGLYKAIEEGESIGATAIQIFTKSSRSWFVKKLTEDEIIKFKEIHKKSKIKVIIAHSSYLINLGSPKKDIEKKSVLSLKQELDRCEELNIPYLVIHPGAYLDSDEQTCIKQISKNLDIILKNSIGKTKILLETTAGQGTNIGHKFEQLKTIYDNCEEKDKLGFCLDTCHIFSAGYDISTEPGYEKTIKDFSKILGLKNLYAIHLNDSKTELNSRKDRHENIGQGKIPKKTFSLIMNDKRLEKIPKILETPVEKTQDYEKEIVFLKSLVK
ncbi:deoxyribonuclease IV [Candidatus Dependentiae bacterium]|nr:deoxyribonuclease IV [Candidatus Dependentiae bacterium]MBU4386860.1 deoxyribonuclease IV [Candidatus Dependentiae bacterium]MCG2756360.1 deoxyribonuclease IV [Candidatus Dependentiae bacterium]